MDRLNEFRRRQREGGHAIVEAYAELTVGRREVTDTERRATRRVLAEGGSVRSREQAAAEEVAGAFSAHEAQVRAQAQEIRRIAADMSDNWRENGDLWGALGPKDFTLVQEARDSWTELRDACRNAEGRDRAYQDSIRRFASLGPDAVAASEGLISALDAIVSASAEVRALAEEYLVVLNRLGRGQAQ